MKHTLSRTLELLSIHRACDRALRAKLKWMETGDRAELARYNRMARAVNVRILKITMTEWEGGARPVSANELIDCVLADGTVLKSRVAGNLEWRRGVKDVTDIIRYRVIK